MTAGFERWLATVFDHPADGPEWFWAPDFDTVWNALGLSPAATVAYLTRLYGESAVLNGYSLAQVARGIWFLVGDSPAQPSHALLDADVALADRVACVRSTAAFFRDFVTPRADGVADTERDPFHIACYMWWDLFPTWGGPRAGETRLHEACLQTMAEILTLPSELCQLTALHGLNHWHLHHARVVEGAIDAFLGRDDTLTNRVRSYAAAARRGAAA